MNHVEIHQHKP